MRFSTICSSLWEDESFYQPKDLVIIGAGIVGLMSALFVKKQRPQWTIAVLERGSIPTGASTRNAGFACYGSPTELLADIKDLGWKDVIDIVQMRKQGLDILRSVVGDTALQYDPCGGYEVFTSDQQLLFEACMEVLPQLNQELAFVGAHPYRESTSQESLGFRHTISCPYEGSIHPGKMMQKLFRVCQQMGIQIMTGVEVEQLQESSTHVSLITPHKIEIRSSLAVIATNGFAKQLIPTLALNAVRNQVLVTSPLPNVRLPGIYHYDCGYVYFRNVGDRILIGGGRNQFARQEETATFGNTTNIEAYLTAILQKNILGDQAFTIDYRWSGILGVGPSKMPIVQWQTDRIFVACRMGGMGVAIGSQIGANVANSILKG